MGQQAVIMGQVYILFCNLQFMLELLICVEFCPAAWEGVALKGCRMLGSEDCSWQTTVCGPNRAPHLFVIVNKVLFESSRTHLLLYCLWWFSLYKGRDRRVPEGLNIYYLAIYRKTNCPLVALGLST